MTFLTELFFHSTRRTGRLPFAFGITVLVGAWWGVERAVELGLSGWFAAPVKALIAYSSLCVLSLRLHDCGRSGWWAWLITGTLVTATLIQPPYSSFMLAAGFLVLLLLGLFPGQRGLNRHGPPSSQRLSQARG
ncbi:MULTISPECIES: DUF805 domain-containing protein [unclassified Brevundimonas]|uniref:DUF805 domain-containing protein n=1 Tax=unclassified Brevundimonas TaxID=2622653 RepID=UPI0025B8A567|nr:MULTISPECIES: DUF805 domain-containing protein [unclassified Brevundimonas]